VTQRTRPRELTRILPLRDLASRESIAAGGKGLDDVFGIVGGGDEGRGVEKSLGVGYLHVEGFWDEHVYAVAQVFDEADRCGGGRNVSRKEGGRNAWWATGNELRVLRDVAGLDV